MPFKIGPVLKIGQCLTQCFMLKLCSQLTFAAAVMIMMMMMMVKQLNPFSSVLHFQLLTWIWQKLRGQDLSYIHGQRWGDSALRGQFIQLLDDASLILGHFLNRALGSLSPRNNKLWGAWFSKLGCDKLESRHCAFFFQECLTEFTRQSPHFTSKGVEFGALPGINRK